MNKALLAAAMAALLCACARHGGNGDDVTSPVQKITGLDMVETKGGKSSWRLKSPTAKILEKTGKALLTDPEMEFIEDGATVSRIRAKRGELQLESKDMVLTEDVVAHSLKDNTTLETTLLRYSSSRKKIYTEKEVIITKEGTRMRGDNFEANPDMSELSVEHQQTLLPEKQK